MAVRPIPNDSWRQAIIDLAAVVSLPFGFDDHTETPSQFDHGHIVDGNDDRVATVDYGEHSDAELRYLVACANAAPVLLAELASLRARIDAAIAECMRLEDERGHSGDETLGSRHAARAIRAKLEGR